LLQAPAPGKEFVTSSTKPRGPVSIVIPAFNEEESIQSSIREVAAAMEPSGVEYELIVVDDGSADATGE
jgi:glycosyltransferase involved in cell wall biosynthesis